MANLRIALDYDGTYSADTVLWQQFMTLARSRGHTVFCLTRRWKRDRPVPEEGAMFQVVYCNDADKIPALMSQGEAQADIYIDDRPWELGKPHG